MPEEPNEPNIEELERKAETGELTEQELQETLNAYAEALRQEFEERNAEAPESIELHTRQFFKDNVATAAAQIVWLSNNAESETVKLNASKMIVQTALQVEKESDDPVQNIINGLRKNDSKEQPIVRED